MFVSGLSVKIEEYPLFNLYRLVLRDEYAANRTVTQEFSSRADLEAELERLAQLARRFVLQAAGQLVEVAEVFRE